LFIFTVTYAEDRAVIMDTTAPPTQAADTGPRKFFVAGVEVEFPVKPYKCQISTMNMVRASLGVLAYYMNICVQEWADGVLLLPSLSVSTFAAEVLDVYTFILFVTAVTLLYVIPLEHVKFGECLLPCIPFHVDL
jgi:hypothetical protein